MNDKPFCCGMLIFPNLTQLDPTGPYEILAHLPGSPETAPPAVREALLARAAPRQKDRARAERVARAAAALSG